MPFCPYCFDYFYGIINGASENGGAGFVLFAKESGFDRIELNMWEFNEDAREFYDALGFKTYRRYMEMKICGGEK